MKTSEILQSVLAVGKYLESNPQKPITNADRIRAMTDEELAELFWIRADCKLCPNRKDHCSDDCRKAWLDWLKQECDDNGT